MLHVIDDLKMRISVNEVLAFIGAIHFDQSRPILTIV